MKKTVSQLLLFVKEDHFMVELNRRALLSIANIFDVSERNISKIGLYQVLRRNVRKCLKMSIKWLTYKNSCCSTTVLLLVTERNGGSTPFFVDFQRMPCQSARPSGVVPVFPSSQERNPDWTESFRFFYVRTHGTRLLVVVLAQPYCPASILHPEKCSFHRFWVPNNANPTMGPHSFLMAPLQLKIIAYS